MVTAAAAISTVAAAAVAAMAATTAVAPGPSCAFPLPVGSSPPTNTLPRHGYPHAYEYPPRPALPMS